MKWNEGGTRFQFQTELFPFCRKCIPTIESLIELNDQVQNLLRRIDQVCANISGEILLSKNKCQRILKLRDSAEWRDQKNGYENVSLGKCQFDVEKVCSLRDVIYKRFTTSVSLTPLEKFVKVDHAKKVKITEDVCGGESYEDFGSDPKASSKKGGVSKNEGESKVRVGPRRDTGGRLTEIPVSGSGCNLPGAAVTIESRNLRKRDVSPEVDTIVGGSGTSKGSRSRLNEDILDRVGSDLEEQDIKNEKDDSEDSDYSPSKSPAFGEESEVEFDHVGGCNASDDSSHSRVNKTSISTRRNRKKTKMSVGVGKLALRVRNIDDTHFIFDEKFPFERNEDGSWRCGTCGCQFTRRHNMNLHLLSSCIESRKLEILPEEDSFKYGGHVFQKLGEHQFKCSDCDNLAETKELAMGHIRSSHMLHRDAHRSKSNQAEKLPDGNFKYRGFIFRKIGNYKFKCAQCSHISETQKKAMGHIRNFHFDGSSLLNDLGLEIVEFEPGRFRLGDEHEFQVINGQYFKCLTCDKHFNSRKTLLDHVIKCHISDSKDETRKFGINNFVEVKPDVYVYADKYEVIKTGEKYKCPECVYVTSNKINMWRHLCYRHLNNKRFKCDQCGKGFPIPFELNQHKKSAHGNEKTFMCESCGKTFSTNMLLRNHMYRSHAEKKNLCTFCGKPFTTYSLLLMHLKVHTGVIVNSVVCEVCGKEMPKRTLKYHMAIHGDPQFSCTECNKKYYHEKTLQMHIATHGGAKPHPCKLCSKSFAWKSALKYHNWRFHSKHTPELDKKRKGRRKPGSGPYPCDICGKGFYEKRGIDGHKIRYHSEKTAELDRQLKEKLSKRRKPVAKVVENNKDFSESEEVDEEEYYA
ncbi:unnamed protein product [Allacma fusca]|uniref:C2H2-type domain-containing protein n=1 Tax=Allacma fusca TaxID=39272 RepID=A0A8J2JZT6_9HEXA|nr:unnamed protein product [Allacma fusca]